MFQTGHCCPDAPRELQETGGAPWRRPAAPPAGARRGDGRVRGAALAAAAAAAMPILVEASAGAGTRPAWRSVGTRGSAEAFAFGARRAAATVSPSVPSLLPQTLASDDQAGCQGQAR